MIEKILGELYRGEIASEHAVEKLCQKASEEALAEFIVNAFNRGWVTPFNVGLNEKGRKI